MSVAALCSDDLQDSLSILKMRSFL